MPHDPLPKKGVTNFIIMGCQRSGTTLLGMVLEAHPQIDLIEEDDTRFHGKGNVTRELRIEAVLGKPSEKGRLTGYKAPRDSHRVEELAKALPDLRVIWIEREKYQVAASMLALKTAQGSWAANFAPREIAKYVFASNDQSVRALLDRANGIDDQAAKEAAMAGLCWAIKRRQGEQAARCLGQRFLKVAYDDLVADPEGVLKTVLSFLGLEWNAGVLEHPRRIENRPRPGGSKPARPIDLTSLGKWKESLTAVELECITYYGAALD